jgi:hypothetical protein
LSVYLSLERKENNSGSKRKFWSSVTGRCPPMSPSFGRICAAFSSLSPVQLALSSEGEVRNHAKMNIR